MNTQTSNSAVFIDTCIFESYNFDFSTKIFLDLESACTTAGVRLLLPDVINREIVRHIKEKSNQAIEAVTSVKRKHPILRQWDTFPSSTDMRRTQSELYLKIVGDWKKFKTRLNCFDIGYENINFKRLMDSYDRMEAPFGPGKKRKEFPDAFAIFSILGYLENSQEYVSVVSSDLGVGDACEPISEFSYFKTLAAFTESLLEGAENLSEIQIAVESKILEIEQNVLDEAMDLEVYHSHENISARLIEVTSCNLYEKNIVAIGRNQCTVVFKAEIDAGVELDVINGDWWGEFSGGDSFFLRKVQLEGRVILYFDEMFRDFETSPRVELRYGDFEAEVELSEI